MKHKRESVKIFKRAFIIAFAIYGTVLSIIYVKTWHSLKLTGSETIDELFTKVATRHPSFGGMYVDEYKDILYVYADPVELDAIVEDLRLVFGKDNLPNNPKALKPKFSFLDLKKYHDRLSWIFLVPGVTMTDIDDYRNRINVGVKNNGAKFTVGILVNILNIPHGMVEITL